MRFVCVLIVVMCIAGCKGREDDISALKQEAARLAEVLEEPQEPEKKESPADPQRVQDMAASEMKELARGHFVPCDDDSHDGIANENGVIMQPSVLGFQVHEKILPLGKHAVPELVNWLDHDDSHVRLMAYVALMYLTDTIGDAEFSWADSPVDLRDSGELEKYRRECLEWYEKNK